MASPEDIAHQQKLLAIHRRNLQHYLGQQAQLGPAQTPIGTLNGIEEERANIRRLKGILRGWGQSVDDQPDDVAPPRTETTTQSGQGSSTSIGRDQRNIHDSPGAIAGSTGDVAQNYGTQNTTNAGTVIYIQGGDFRGSNLPIGNSIGGDLKQQGGQSTMSTFNQPNWKVEGNVYNIAGDLNMSAAPDKSELLAALRQLKGEIEKAKDLSADDADDLKTNLDAATKAVERDQPNKDRAVEKLSTMKKVIDGLKDNVASALALGNLIGQALLAAQNIRF